jgi:hypothetical protein
LPDVRGEGTSVNGAGLDREGAMHRCLGVTVVCVLLSSVTAWAGEQSGRRRGHREASRAHDTSRTRPSRDSQVAVHVVFSNAETHLMREHYQTRYRNLPPGLKKKYARTGQLPPGWQKKVEPLPVELERRMVALSPEHRRGILDGHAVIYNPRTQVIIDATLLF